MGTRTREADAAVLNDTLAVEVVEELQKIKFLPVNQRLMDADFPCAADGAAGANVVTIDRQLAVYGDRRLRRRFRYSEGVLVELMHGVGPGQLDPIRDPVRFRTLKSQITRRLNTRYGDRVVRRNRGLFGECWIVLPEEKP